MPLTSGSLLKKGFLLLLFLPLSVVASHQSGVAVDPICNEKHAYRASKYSTYLGCYDQACFRNITRLTVQDIDECTYGCLNESYHFAALSDGDTCYCGGLTCSKNSTVCDSKCGIPCESAWTSIHDKTCGGIGFIQVYYHDLPVKKHSDINIHHLAVCITVAVLVFSVVIVAGVFISRRKRAPPTTRLTALPSSDSNHRYSTYVIDVSSREADDYEALINMAQLCQKGGSSTDTKRIINTVTSELGPGACADPKATGSTCSKQTLDASKGYCSPDGYLEPDDDQSFHDYAYPTPAKSYTYQTSEVDSCSSQTGEDGYMFMKPIP